MRREDLPAYDDLPIVRHLASCPDCARMLGYCPVGHIVYNVMSDEEKVALHVDTIQRRMDESWEWCVLGSDGFSPRWLTAIEAAMVLGHVESLPDDLSEAMEMQSGSLMASCVHPSAPYEVKRTYYLDMINGWSGDYFIYRKGERLSVGQAASLMAERWCVWECIAPSPFRILGDDDDFEEVAQRLISSIERQVEQGTVMLLFTEEDGFPTDEDRQLAIALAQQERAMDGGERSETNV